jgi:flagellar hook-associated protein 2
MPLINFTGLASGIDSEALIEATSDVTRQAKVEPHEDKISELEDTNDALSELKEKLSSLKTIVDGFSTLNGGAIAKEGVSSDETVVTATASNTAYNGSYGITVNQIAKNGTISFDDRYASTTTALGVNNPGTMTIDIGSGPEESVVVNLINTSTVDDFISEFNNNSSYATASAVNIGTESSPSYAIMITSNETGLEKGQLTATAGGGLAGFPSGTTTDQATDAQFTIDGISGAITRATNTVSDLLPGVTFSIEDTGSATITVATDVATTSANIEEFVSLYNEIKEFVNENNLIEREESGDEVDNIFGALASTRLDDNVLTSIRNDMSSASASGTTVAIFADLGITTERDGTLKLNNDTLEGAITDEPNSVGEILTAFADSAGNTGGTIDQYIRFNGLFDTTINSNKERISDLNDDISEAEKFIAKQEESMRARFARLEKLMAEMQSQQSNLVSILGGLTNN